MFLTAMSQSNENQLAFPSASVPYYSCYAVDEKTQPHNWVCASKCCLFSIMKLVSYQLRPVKTAELKVIDGSKEKFANSLEKKP